MRTALTLVYFQIYGKNLILFQFIKITHMSKKWGTPQNFLLAFIDELWKTWKIRFLKKQKKIAGDIIILQTCTKNHNHIRYSSWDMEWDNFFVILGHFLPFTFSLTIQKTKILKKWKKHLGMSSFQTCATKTNQMIYAYSDMECNRHNFLSFWLFSHYWPQKSKFQKNVKTTWRYYPFTHVHHKSRSYVWFLWYKDKNAKAKVFCHFRPFFAFWPS